MKQTETSLSFLYMRFTLIDGVLLHDLECASRERERETEWKWKRVFIHNDQTRERETTRRKMRLAVLATLIYVMIIVQSTVHAADFLFVQTETGATLNGTLTMTCVGQDTTYFSDRPVCVAGRMSTEEFLTLFEPSGTFSEVRLCHARVYLCVE